MAYDELTPGWRRAYGILGSVFLIVGILGTITEIMLALQGYILAWFAAAIGIGLAALGAFLLVSVRNGRIRTLGLGRRPPAA